MEYLTYGITPFTIATFRRFCIRHILNSNSAVTNVNSEKFSDSEIFIVRLVLKTLLTTEDAILFSKFRHVFLSFCFVLHFTEMLR